MTYRSMLDHYFSSRRPLFSLSNRVWNPPTDIFETDKTTILKMEVAGLNMEELRITSQRNLLIVRGRRRQCQPESRVNYHLMEIHYGDFERVFGFSHDLDDGEISAQYKDGFLIVEVRKSDQKPQKVIVQIIDDSTGIEDK